MEERNFEVRKSLLEYDEVMDQQRKRVYGYRQGILDGENCRDLLLRDDRPPDRSVPRPLPRQGLWRDLRQMGRHALVCELDAADFRGLDYATADLFAKD